MATAIYERGNVFLFTTAFTNELGSPVTPTSATLKIVVGEYSEVLPMVLSGQLWSVKWDSFGHPVGIVYWSVQATVPHATDEGNFMLTANRANQAAV